MQYINENSGYAKSIRTSLSSGRQQQKQRNQSQNQNPDILGNINYMIQRLDKLQNAIQNRQKETKDQLKNYNKENTAIYDNQKLKIADICKGKNNDLRTLTFGTKQRLSVDKYHSDSNQFNVQLKLLERKQYKIE